MQEQLARLQRERLQSARAQRQQEELISEVKSEYPHAHTHACALSLACVNWKSAMRVHICYCASDCFSHVAAFRLPSVSVFMLLVCVDNVDVPCMRMLTLAAWCCYWTGGEAPRAAKQSVAGVANAHLRVR